MANHHKHRDLHRLIKSWDEKLKDSGFNDIENRLGYFIDHRSFYDLSLRKNFATTDAFEATRSYFQRARWLATNFNFESEELKIIWELHSEGYSLSEISRKVKMSNQNIHNRIQKIRKILVDKLKK